MMLGAASSSTVVAAMKSGANDFMMKPINPEDLRKTLKLVLDGRLPASPKPAEEPGSSPESQVFYGRSTLMRSLQKILPQIGSPDAPVLIQGETGVGKEVVAH
jgi:DNA-binding NtrC family response regulator